MPNMLKAKLYRIIKKTWIYAILVILSIGILAAWYLNRGDIRGAQAGWWNPALSSLTLANAGQAAGIIR